MKTTTEYVVKWKSSASNNEWRFHCAHQTEKAALKKRDERRRIEPNIQFCAVKVVTTEL